MTQVALNNVLGHTVVDHARANRVTELMGLKVVEFASCVPNLLTVGQRIDRVDKRALLDWMTRPSATRTCLTSWAWRTPSPRRTWRQRWYATSRSSCWSWAPTSASWAGS